MKLMVSINNKFGDQSILPASGMENEIGEGLLNTNGGVMKPVVGSRN